MSNSVDVVENTPRLRADGSLANLGDWTPEIAEQMARDEGLTLTQQHWDVINTLRNYYKAYNISPIFKLLRREIVKKFGAERASEEALAALFPRGVQHQASRLAGVPLALLDAELDHDSSERAVQPVGGGSSGSLNTEFDFKGKTISLYASGNLANLEDWSEDLAVALAEKEGIQLTDEHWMVISFLRRFYFKYGVAPMVAILIKHMTEELGSEVADKAHLYELFPKGPARQGSRIAGLPSPQGCIDD